MIRKLPIYLLENGMRVVVDDVKYVETVALGFFIKVGSRDEQDKHDGMAHFLEHIIFKTKDKNGKSIADIIEGRGGQVDAYTTRELTAYHFKVLKNDVGLALKLLSDCLMKPNFNDEDINTEKKIILQEIIQDDGNIESIFDNEIFQLAYGKQNLGQKVIGSKASIEKISKKDIYQFMNENYCSDKCAISVSGNVDKKEVLEDIIRLFEKWPYACPFVNKKDRYYGGYKQIKNGGDKVFFQIGYNAPSYENIRDVYATKLLKMALTGGITSKLYQEMREKRGLVYSIKSSYIVFTDNGLFTISGAVAKNKYNEALNVLKDELKKVSLRGYIKNSDLNIMKAQIRAGISFEMEGMTARIIRDAYQVLFYNDLYSVEYILDLIESITVNDISKIAKKIFTGKESLVEII